MREKATWFQSSFLPPEQSSRADIWVKMRRGRASGVAHGGDSDDDEDDQRMAMLRAVAVDGAAILGQFAHFPPDIVLREISPRLEREVVE